MYANVPTRTSAHSCQFVLKLVQATYRLDGETSVKPCRNPGEIPEYPFVEVSLFPSNRAGR